MPTWPFWISLVRTAFVAMSAVLTSPLTMSSLNTVSLPSSADAVPLIANANSAM